MLKWLRPPTADHYGQQYYAVIQYIDMANTYHYGQQYYAVILFWNIISIIIILIQKIRFIHIK